MTDEQYAVDVDYEIAGLELEIQDTRRDMRWAGWIGTATAVLIVAFGKEVMSQSETYLAAGIVVAIVGVKDHLYRNRIKQAHDQIVNCKLWAQSEHQSARRAMRIVRALDDLPPRSEAK